MKLIDAILRVERPEAKSPWDFSAPIPEMCSDLSISEIHSHPDELLARIKEYPIFNWLCTDEMVGLSALYLDGESVGACYRSGRKMSYVFHWLSYEDANKTRDVLLSYLVDDSNIPVSLVGDLAIEDFRYLGEEDTRIRVEPA
jgi:hypothetical protein